MLRFLERLSGWFPARHKLTQTRKTIVLNDLIDSSSPNTGFFVLIILSCTIATLGLIMDSPAVIIGAMLVAPLMSPILGLSMASISGLSRLFKRSLRGVVEGVGLAIALSTVIAYLAYRLPFGDLANISNEVLSRTQPSLLDLGVALAGGAAAAYALAHPRLSAALPGVAISTALMPPVCTIGIGIAFLDSSIVFGASLLFLTNLAAISFSGIITFALMGFSPGRNDKDSRLSRSVTITAILVVSIGILLGVFTWRTLGEARLYNNASNAVLDSVSKFTDARLLDLSITDEGAAKSINVTLRTSRELTAGEGLELQDHLADTLGSPVVLELVVIPMQVINPSKIPLD